MSNISESTKITIGVAATLAVIIFSVGVVYAKVLDAEETNIKQDTKLEAIYKIETNIEVMRATIERIEKRLDK